LIVPAADGVLKNDSDADGDGLEGIVVANVQHGTLSLNKDNGSFTYTPAGNFHGSDGLPTGERWLNRWQTRSRSSLTVDSVNDVPPPGPMPYDAT